MLVAATACLFDNLAPDVVVEASARIRQLLPGRLRLVCAAIQSGRKLAAGELDSISQLAQQAIAWKPPSP